MRTKRWNLSSETAVSLGNPQAQTIQIVDPVAGGDEEVEFDSKRKKSKIPPLVMSKAEKEPASSNNRVAWIVTTRIKK
jgi:hypothetical protein